MRKSLTVILTGVFLLTVFGIIMLPAAEETEGKLTIDKPASVWPAAKLDKKTGAKKKPPVTFNHKKHGTDQSCESCHYTATKTDTGELEVKSCFAADCHGPEDVTTAEGKLQPDSYKIIHDKKVGICLLCHTKHKKSMEEQKLTSKAPTKCADCHVE